MCAVETLLVVATGGNGAATVLVFCVVEALLVFATAAGVLLVSSAVVLALGAGVGYMAFGQLEPSLGMTYTRPPGMDASAPLQYHKTRHLSYLPMMKVVTGGGP